VAKAHVNLLLKFFTTLQAELTHAPRGGHPGKDFARERLCSRMRKRALLPNPGLKDKAIDNFLQLNEAVKGTSISLANREIHLASLFIRFVLEKQTRSYDPDGVQEVLHWPAVFDQWRFGPGASNGITGTHVAEKVGQVMTTTLSNKPLTDQIRMMSPYHRAKDGAYGAGSSLIEGSKLAVVPKNEDTMRTIAIEPSGNMAVQLGAGRYIEDALRGIGLDIKTQQPKNKLLALRGSLDGQLSTIDLKSASDLITLDLVRLLWPPEWFDLFEKSRSARMKVRDEYITLNMISTMGNGFTFPMMTLTLLSLVVANRVLLSNFEVSHRRVDWKRTAVFGDDIIVPTAEFLPLCDMLTRAGLIVNNDKSYSAGPFRESCGGDYYEGYDVTPFYVKSLCSNAEIYVAINQLLQWCCKHNTSLPQSLAVLVSGIVGRVFFVPEWYGDDAGIRTALVARRFEYLRPKPVRVRLRSLDFAVMLISGGYLIPGDKPDQMFFAPRVKNPKSEVRKGRLPEGWLSGWDPCLRSHQESDHVIELLKMIG